ncbi:MAG: hypothetical protein NWE93_11365 [Candidatus Bathyarchaeota archaeon]|nr:hypothetical protein [Candidatus Bathyarchaeota archaeon]
MELTNHPQIAEWLEECRRESTKRIYWYAISRFFNWYTDYLKKKNQSSDHPIETYLSKPNKDKRHLALIYQNTFTGPDNTACGVLTALSSFLTYLDQPINWQHKRKKIQPDTTSHEFTTDDFTRMFNAADTKGKALLALGTSLGWEIGATLELEREFMKSLIAKARSEKREYYYFKTFRQKTGAPRLGVLNPLAIQWVGKYLDETEGKRLRRRTGKEACNQISNIFDIRTTSINKYLKRIAGEARIVTTGRVHWHKIRGWVMSTLSRAGLNEFQIKYIVGKTIPVSDSTYLQSLMLEIEERYPQAYELYLNIGAAVSSKTVKKLILDREQKDRKLEELQARLNTLEAAKPTLEALLRKVEALETQLKQS